METVNSELLDGLKVKTFGFSGKGTPEPQFFGIDNVKTPVGCLKRVNSLPEAAITEGSGRYEIAVAMTIMRSQSMTDLEEPEPYLSIIIIFSYV